MVDTLGQGTQRSLCPKPPLTTLSGGTHDPLTMCSHVNRCKIQVFTHEQVAQPMCSHMNRSGTALFTHEHILYLFTHEQVGLVRGHLALWNRQGHWPRTGHRSQGLAYRTGTSCGASERGSGQGTPLGFSFRRLAIVDRDCSSLSITQGRYGGTALTASSAVAKHLCRSSHRRAVSPRSCWSR
jgi:hypothetical protein